MGKKTNVFAAFSCTLAMSLMLCQTSVSAATLPASSSDYQTNAPLILSGASNSLTYTFQTKKAGYAEGTLSLTASEAGSYSLYWSTDKAALQGYYEITTLTVEAGQTATFSFGYHTAIPADATKVIAVAAGSSETYRTPANAIAVYDLPKEKQLAYRSSDALYTFNSFSDIHIDEEHFGETPAYWWEYSEAHWAGALDYATKLGVDFIVSSGDQVTNAKLDNLNKEWKAYQLILSQSDYVNPIYESGGNHEVRQDGAVADELQAFIVGSGLDSAANTLTAGKPYYSITEPNTGDLFIFMALETGYRPAKYDEFSNEQLDWVEKLLKENYGKGKNIYIVQHALIKGYGPGDDLTTPYYGGSIDKELPSAKRFISLLEAYPNIVWISGHSHEAFSLGYNFTNNQGASCNMIHNPSVGNPTHVTNGAIDYAFNENLSQGYYVQTFQDAILFCGANLCDQKIYPAYTYIIDGNTSLNKQAASSITLYSDVEVTDATLRSVLANVNTVLGLYYEFSSYDQYQTLKNYYYQYKDLDTKAMSNAEILTIYSQLRQSIASLHQIAGTMLASAGK